MGMRRWKEKTHLTGEGENAVQHGLEVGGRECPHWRRFGTTTVGRIGGGGLDQNKRVRVGPRARHLEHQVENPWHNSRDERVD